MDNRQFDPRLGYCVNVTLLTGGFLTDVLKVGIDDDSLELQQKLDEEYARLEQDRELLRSFIFRGRDVSINDALPANLLRLVQNTSQIYSIDRRKPSDLAPAYIVDAVQVLADKLIVVRSDDELSREAADNAALIFRTHLRATFPARQVFEGSHLNSEAFDWVWDRPRPNSISRSLILGNVWYSSRAVDW